MKLWAVLTVLRRIAVALESLVEIERDRILRDYPPLVESTPPAKTTISHPTPNDWNERWRRRQLLKGK